MTMYQLGSTRLAWVRYALNNCTGYLSCLHMLYPVCCLQNCMAFYKDQENVVSAAMTATQNLMDKYHIDPRSVGRLWLCQ